MSQDQPFPAIPTSQLGTTAQIDIDRALIPYIVGSLQSLLDPDNFYGQAADIEATTEAFDSLLVDLSNVV